MRISEGAIFLHAAAKFGGVLHNFLNFFLLNNYFEGGDFLQHVFGPKASHQ